MASEDCVVNVLDLFTSSKFGTMIQDFTKTVEAWHLVLLPLDDDVVLQAAVILARKESDFVPSAGAVFQQALGLLDTEPSSDEAWQHIVKYSRNASLPDASNPTKLTDREARALALMGGNCGQWLEKDLSFRRREFIDVYERLRSEWRTRAALPSGQSWPALGTG